MYCYHLKVEGMYITFYDSGNCLNTLMKFVFVILIAVGLLASMSFFNVIFATFGRHQIAELVNYIDHHCCPQVSNECATLNCPWTAINVSITLKYYQFSEGVDIFTSVPYLPKDSSKPNLNQSSNYIFWTSQNRSIFVDFVNIPDKLRVLFREK